MRAAGIICEYNPYHNGHNYQVKCLREAGFDCVVGVMSGNYTQRGEMAIADKYVRAKAAVAGGVDLILELPFPFSAMSAEGFARAGVHILSSMGVDTLSFGSECADKTLLSEAALTIRSQEFIDAYSRKKQDGAAQSFFDTLKEFCKTDISPLSNDILAIAYMAAIADLGADMEVYPIKRVGMEYRESVLKSAMHPSATALREAIKNRAGGFFSELDDHLPNGALSALRDAQSGNLAPVLIDKLSAEILSFFRMLSPAEIAARAVTRSGGGISIAEDGCGLVERICNAARTAEDIGELLDASYNSRFTDARVRRVMLFSLLGVSDAFARSLPQYTTVLAANERGRAFLSDARKRVSFPIITKPADAPESYHTNILRLSDSLYASAMPKALAQDHFIKCHPYML